MPDFVELQRRFIATTDLAAFWNDFLDHWAMQPGFMDLGGPAETGEMEILVAFIAGKMYGRMVEPEAMQLVKIAESGFVHGAFQIEGELACVLYFEGLDKGLIVAPGEGGKTNYARFSWHFGKAGRGGSGLPN